MQEKVQQCLPYLMCYKADKSLCLYFTISFYGMVLFKSMFQQGLVCTGCVMRKYVFVICNQLRFKQVSQLQRLAETGYFIDSSFHCIHKMPCQM